MAPLQSFVRERPLMSSNATYRVISAPCSTGSEFCPLVEATNSTETNSGPSPQTRMFIALAISICLFFSVAAFAQSDVGTIVGFVKDQSGAVVPNATVAIRNEATGELHTVTSDEQGHYVAPSLTPAYYSMTSEAKGFQKFTSSHNKLDSNSTIEIDAALAVGAETQTVEVTGTASVLQTQSGA